MSGAKLKRAATAIFATTLAMAGAAAAAPQCFDTRNWHGWKATPDGGSIYIGVDPHRVYKLDFTPSCTIANQSGMHLDLHAHSSFSVCSATDAEVSVSDGHGLHMNCNLSSIRPLSADEASALPPNLRP